MVSYRDCLTQHFTRRLPTSCGIKTTSRCCMTSLYLFVCVCVYAEISVHVCHEIKTKCYILLIYTLLFLSFFFSFAVNFLLYLVGQCPFQSTWTLRIWSNYIKNTVHIMKDASSIPRSVIKLTFPLSTMQENRRRKKKEKKTNKRKGYFL